MYSNLRKLLQGAALFLASLLIIIICSGCGVVTRHILERTVDADPPLDESYAKSLKPVPSGPGLVVCEPVISLSDNDNATQLFGIGCGRWLNLHAAGQGQLSKTPFWGAVDDIRKQMKRANLQLEPKDGEIFARFCGVTHVALGTLTGNASQATLTYQLYAVEPKFAPAGMPFTIAGTPAQIVNGLPALARKIAVGAGAKNPRVPVFNLTMDDVSFLGQVPWKARTSISMEEASRLAEISSREPLAGILFLRSGRAGHLPVERRRVINSLLRSANTNTIAVADIMRFYAGEMETDGAIVSRNLAQFPTNYLAAAAKMKWLQSMGAWQKAAPVAEDMVRIAPNNSLAWMDLAQFQWDRADSIRNRRYMSKMTQQEIQAISKFYPLELSAAYKATQVSENNSSCWVELAKAAAFAGYEQMADSALQTALKINPSDGKAYGWGLQMYQPKWQGKPSKLLNVAREAVQYCDPEEFPGEDLINAINYGGLMKYKEELLSSALKLCPDDANVNTQYGALLYYDKNDPAGALKCYQMALTTDPTDVQANYELGAIYHYTNRDYVTAEKYYRTALTHNPKYARAVSSLGDIYFFVKHDSQQAGEFYRQAVQLAPHNDHLKANLDRFEAATQNAPQ